MKYYLQDIINFLFCIIGSLAVLGVIALVGSRIEKRHCLRAYAQYQPEWVGIVTGCMITIDEDRVPASSLRLTI